MAELFSQSGGFYKKTVNSAKAGSLKAEDVARNEGYIAGISGVKSLIEDSSAQKFSPYL